jgi:hypothetical protein
MLLIAFIDDKRLTVQQNFKGFCENNWSLGFSKKVYLNKWGTMLLKFLLQEDWKHRFTV